MSQRRVCSGPTTQNWLTARKSLFAGVDQSMKRTVSVVRPPSSVANVTFAPSRKQLPDRPVRADAIHRGAVEDQFLDRRVERGRRQVGIQLGELRPEPVLEDDLGPIIATGRAGRDMLGAELLVIGVDDLVAELTEQLERRLLDEVLLREALGRHCVLRRVEGAEVDVGDVEPAGDEAWEEEVAGARRVASLL